MADDYHTLGMLLQPGANPPVFTSAEQVFEYHDEFLYQKTDEGFIDYVMSGSRKDGLKYALEKLCGMAGISNLGFLYGSEAVQYEWVFEESIEGWGTWCVWKGLIVKPGDMKQAVSAIATLFDWSQQHISEISNKDFFGYFTDDEDDIKNAITQPVITKHPTSDDRVWYCDEGDGPWCLYAYLCSMQQLMRNALEQKLALMYMVQVPSPDPQAAQRKLDLEKFNSVPHYFYADGSAILKGDAVLFDYGRFPGLVIDFMVSTGTDGKLFPAAVLVGEGKQGQQRAVGLNAMTGGRFSELQFVERNTTDFVRAGVDWLHQRATQGDASAQFSLGNLYVIGNSVAQDDAQGIAWWRKAADKSYALAQFHLGGMYYRGQGVAVDQTQARQWWRKAAEQGHPVAQFQIGFAYAHGLDVVQNMEQACDWYRKAADQGYSSAQYNLAHSYQEGTGVAQDFAIAVEWYRKAAEQGHSWAQCNLADKYEHGLGVQQDYVQAIQWYLKSAAQGVAPAMYSLGGMNKNGLGVAPNDQAAAQWWRKAAALGYEDAKKSLEALAPNLGESTP